MTKKIVGIVLLAVLIIGGGSVIGNNSHVYAGTEDDVEVGSEEANANDAVNDNAEAVAEAEEEAEEDDSSDSSDD